MRAAFTNTTTVSQSAVNDLVDRLKRAFDETGIAALPASAPDAPGLTVVVAQQEEENADEPGASISFHGWLPPDKAPLFLKAIEPFRQNEDDWGLLSYLAMNEYRAGREFFCLYGSA